MARNFGDKRRRKGKGQPAKKTKSNGSKEPQDYPGPRQETVTCREVAIYEGPIDDSTKRPKRNKREPKRDNSSRSEPKQQRDQSQKQRRPDPGRYGTRNPRAYFFDVTDNEESEEEDYDDEEEGEYEYIRNRPRRRDDDEVPVAFIEAAVMSIMMERMMVNEMMSRRGGRNSSSASSTNSFMNRLSSMFSR